MRVGAGGVRRLVRTALIVLPALGLGYAVLGSGLDRMSAANPALSATVPQAFRAAAWRSGAALDNAKGRSVAAREKATLAILADPMDAAASSSLGLARLKLREGVAAEAAFRVAGQLGWRDKTTQLYWMALSAASGAFPLAAQRADALLRQDARLREQPSLLAPLEATGEGRKALATRLAQRPVWFGDYWYKLYLLDPGQLANRSRMLDEPALRPPIMACADVRTMALLLVKSDLGRSRAILQRYCPRRIGDLLTDGGFEAAQLSNTSANGWQFTGEGGLDIRFESAGSAGKTVVVVSTLPMRQVFASQALELAPGRYRVSWRMPGKAVGIVLRLTCQQNAGHFLAATPKARDRLAANAEVGADCPLQWLDLAVDPGAGPVTVDDVKVERADHTNLH